VLAHFRASDVATQYRALYHEFVIDQDLVTA
jgi:hypothetical protein